MAGTIDYLYDPNQDIYVIADCDGDPLVRAGRVIRVRAEVLVTETVLTYDIRLADETGTTEFEEEDVFATLADAVEEYEDRLSP